MKSKKNKSDISPRYLFLALTIICVIFLVFSIFFKDQTKRIKGFFAEFIVPVQEGADKLGGKISKGLDYFGDVKSLRKENEELKEELKSYQNEAAKYQAELSELQELRSLYELDEKYPEYNKTAARVFSTDSSTWFNELYIDKGLNDGVYEGCNVLCDNGLLGIVVESYDDYAKVRAIIDDRSNITAEVGRDNALCNVEGSLKTMEQGYLLVKDINKDAKVEIGDRVITSNVSDRYFFGLTIGYVTEISYDSNNLTKTAKISPAVDFSDVKDVFVIIDRKRVVDY
ncbi:rod shape-determining protein MreC [Eubacterium ruminantium]|uniref:Cell shape-determining protein MreC n=1 Tax=Eubacterium ruminantium TaxID=42322 RepID=A0A1T4M338_9FIRM|nr:rod shape-determining protein MreC [Eubacterium ruminantium]SCW37513.1 rod shape-determining protein MreC [Eubacterium ruminantium]SDM47034.1 rod shape-determining protein MreC [Eubacterium ruminantium]SJZ61305.1 rod shape-determining protein MreC [Eubacterium ruminantium]